MDFSLSAMWANMGVLARLVSIILLVFATGSLGVLIERILFFRRIVSRAGTLGRAVEPLLAKASYDEVLKLCKAQPGVPLAEIIHTGVATYQKGAEEQAAGTGAMNPIELTGRALQRRVQALQAELRRGFPVLASVGSVGPFIGLFGTVVGIITAFEGIAKSGSGGLGAVSAGIAEALVVTALGLAVAIPAVLAFNFLSTRAERLDLALEQSAGELLDLLEQKHGVARGA